MNWTPLNNAARFGHKEIVQLLLSKPGIDINGKGIEFKKYSLYLNSIIF